MISKVVRLIFIIVICAIVSAWLNVHAEPPPSREYLIKVAFLYKFAKFVDWPEKAFPDDRAPLTICILGKEPFGAALETIKDKKVRGRKLVIQRLARLEDMKQCHVLFISASEEKRLPELLSAIKGTAILTVSDMKGFARRGGIINLVTVEKKIRFEINLDAAHLAGLKISSKFLKLAKIVGEEGRKERK